MKRYKSQIICGRGRNLPGLARPPEQLPPQNQRRERKLSRSGVRKVQHTGYQAVFKVPDRITVANTGDAKRVKIATVTLGTVADGKGSVPKV